MTRIRIICILIGVFAVAIIGIAVWNFSAGSNPISHEGKSGNQIGVQPGSGNSSTATQIFSGPAKKYVYIVTIIAPQEAM
jgi:flagellar basal body-associated protein FliL